MAWFLIRLLYELLTNWLVSIGCKILQKNFPKQAINTWILIPIIPRNVFKRNANKIYTKYDKICLFEKHPHENDNRAKKSRVEWSGISLLFSKSMAWLARININTFFNLYITFPWHHQDGKLMKQYIFKTFASFQITLPHLCGILVPNFQMEKTK